MSAKRGNKLHLEAAGRVVTERDHDFDETLTTRVGIVDDRPAVSRGITITLEADNFLVDEHVTDIDEWLTVGGRRLILLGTCRNSDQMELLARLHTPRYEGVPVVVLLADASIAVYRRCLLAGAAGMVDQNESLDYICRVVRASADGWLLLPAAVSTAISLGSDVRQPGVQKGDRETRWLQALADGSTVSEIAVAEGYSEREMYRLLNQLYSRLGVQNRTRAIVHAAQRGLVW